MQWETVIGLEIHVQLATQTKIFSGSAVRFGAEPNVHANEVDLGLPGTLPVVNAEAVRMATMFGLAINADICPSTIFARKNYFYPDLPKGYQTSQADAPIVGPGTLTILPEGGEAKDVRIHHAHLEEDAGKSLHEDYQGMSGIDLNRAGTPLLEIVSEPDMRSAKEAIAYVKAIHAIVTYLGISDGNMAEGSLRCDVNVSVRLKGDELGTRTEIKNLNSFKFIEKAIHGEVERQIELIEDGGKVLQETRLYDPDKNETRAMRSKEEAMDYRYFPCPDLLPIQIEQSFVDEVKAGLPELPQQKKDRFVADYQLSDYDASVLVANKATADYYETVVKASGGEAKLSANWVMVDLAGYLNKSELEIEQSPVSAEQLGQMILRIKDGTISGKIAKTVFEAMCAGEGDADTIIEAKDLKQETDSGAIEKIVDKVLAANPEQVDAFKQADDKKQKKMLGFFVGQIMKASQGKANPQQVNQLLGQKLKS